jgi:hypothetical protein
VPVLHSDVMFAKPLPLFSAFLGGCLFTAALIGFGASERRPRAVTPSERSANVFVSGLETEPEIESEIQTQSASAQVVDDAGTAEEMGSSVADVLARLESAYRKVSVEPTTEASAAQVATAAVPAPSATPEPAPSTAASAVTAVLATAPVNAAAVTESAAATQPAVGTEPVAVTEPEPATYVAEVRADIRAGDVNQGDRYPVEELVVLQYLQLLALSSYAGVSVPPPRAHPPVRAPRLRQPGRSAFPITAIPNPDNPWGYNFPPPALVK